MSDKELEREVDAIAPDLKDLLHDMAIGGLGADALVGQRVSVTYRGDTTQWKHKAGASCNGCHATTMHHPSCKLGSGPVAVFRPDDGQR